MRGRYGVALGLVLAATATSPALAATKVVTGLDSLIWDVPDTDTTDVVIAPGDKVVWTFPGTVQAHNVRSNGGAWTYRSELGVPAPDGEFVFDTEGTYDFVCEVHTTTMFGKVIVSSVPVPTPVPTPVPLSQQPFASDDVAPVALEKVTLDTTKPGLAALSARRVAKGARVRFKVSEESVVSVLVKRAGRTVKTTEVAGTGTHSLTVGGLRAGRYQVQVRATDLAGNRSKLRTLRVTVR